MPALKIRREELEIIKAAATRVARRNNSQFVMDESRLEVTEDGASSGSANDEEEGDDTNKPVICD